MKYSVNKEADILEILNDWDSSNHYLIQEIIQQHEVFSQFNESFVNIMRINSWRHGDTVEIFSQTLRIGVPGHTMNVSYIDGIERISVSQITTDGHCGDAVIDQLGIRRATNEVVSMVDAAIPHWKEIIQIIKNICALNILISSLGILRLQIQRK